MQKVGLRQVRTQTFAPCELHHPWLHFSATKIERVEIHKENNYEQHQEHIHEENKYDKKTIMKNTTMKNCLKNNYERQNEQCLMVGRTDKQT